jgi:uncharacterized membrane protein
VATLFSIASPVISATFRLYPNVRRLLQHFGVLVKLSDENPSVTVQRRQRATFSEDFRRFFRSGLAALLPTLITLWLLTKIWDFLWDTLGRHIIWLIKEWCYRTGAFVQWGQADRFWDLKHPYLAQVLGVGLAILLVYIVGLFVGNLIGRTFWKVGERLAMKIPIIRAIYPAVKQVTDFVLQERRAIESSRVVACQPHEKGIWSIGLVTGDGLATLTESTRQEMVTVFVPSSPTAFSGYVLIVPRENVVELPISVEQAMRMLVSGGVITPEDARRYSEQKVLEKSA